MIEEKSDFAIAKNCFFVCSFTAIYLSTAISFTETKILLGPDGLLEWLKAAIHILSHGRNPLTFACVWIALTQCMAFSYQKVLRIDSFQLFC